MNNGALGRIRTSDRLVRSQVLYPAELRARLSSKGCTCPVEVAHITDKLLIGQAFYYEKSILLFLYSQPGASSLYFFSNAK